VVASTEIGSQIKTLENKWKLQIHIDARLAQRFCGCLDLQSTTSFGDSFFDNFNGKERKIEQAYIVYNEKIFKAFEVQLKSYYELLFGSPEMFEAKDWRKDHFAERTFVSRQFLSLCNKSEWNKNKLIKILLMVHCMDADNVWKFCKTGKLNHPDEPGIFGNGMYFSTSVTHAASLCKSLHKASVVCSVLPGNCYPAVHPSDQKPGFHSNYALVNQSRGIYDQHSNLPLFDELVVFQETQVCPLFAVFTHTSETSKDKKSLRLRNSSPSKIPEEVKPAGKRNRKKASNHPKKKRREKQKARQNALLEEKTQVLTLMPLREDKLKNLNKLDLMPLRKDKVKNLNKFLLYPKNKKLRQYQQKLLQSNFQLKTKKTPK